MTDPVEKLVRALEVIVDLGTRTEMLRVGDAYAENGWIENTTVSDEAEKAAEALSRFNAERNKSVWRSMDTAPRDGTHILLAAGSDFVGEGWWEDNDADPYPWKFIDTGQENYVFKAGEFLNGAHEGTKWAFLFTNWMPMPNPPSMIAAINPEGKT